MNFACCLYSVFTFQLSSVFSLQQRNITIVIDNRKSNQQQQIMSRTTSKKETTDSQPIRHVRDFADKYCDFGCPEYSSCSEAVQMLLRVLDVSMQDGVANHIAPMYKKNTHDDCKHKDDNHFTENLVSELLDRYDSFSLGQDLDKVLKELGDSSYTRKCMNTIIIDIKKYRNHKVHEAFVQLEQIALPLLYLDGLEFYGTLHRAVVKAIKNKQWTNDSVTKFNDCVIEIYKEYRSKRTIRDRNDPFDTMSRLHAYLTGKWEKRNQKLYEQYKPKKPKQYHYK